MSPAIADWLKFCASVLLSLCVLLVAVLAERRAARNESIRARQSVIGDIRTWANSGIGLLTDLADEIETSGKAAPTTLRRLFALADQGRFFFENDYREIHGTQKAPAYQGYRPRILSWLIVGHVVAATYAGYDAEEQVAIMADLRAHFVSDCQELVMLSKLGAMTMKDLDNQLRNGRFMDMTEEHHVIVNARRFVDADHPRFRGMSL